MKSLPAAASDAELLDWSRDLLAHPAIDDEVALEPPAAVAERPVEPCRRAVARQPRRFHEHHKWAHLAHEVP